MNKSIRYNTPFCIVMMDIDHFKKINDTHGHGVGDTVLKELANLVMQHIRASDILARWGGEEFVLLAPSSTLETTRDLAEKLRQLIAAHLFAGHLKITMSFGIAQYAPNDTLKSIIARADSALYISKHEGRNKVTCA
jgi:diguanylate cyclase (GGDEF)-like protein